MFFVPRVNSFWGIAYIKVFVVFKAGNIFEYRYTFIFRYAGIDGGFIDDDIPFFQHPAYGFAGLDHRRQYRFVVLVCRRWDGDDKNIAAGYRRYSVCWKKSTR